MEWFHEIMTYVHGLYEWMVSWAEHPLGWAALFGLSFAESSFFPIPPDPLLMALCLGDPSRAFLFAFLCSAGSLFGGMFGYGLGRWSWTAAQKILFVYIKKQRFHDEIDRVRRLYEKYEGWAVGVAGFTPIPYKVFTLTAGFFRVSFPIFVLASLVSRSARFFIVATVMYFGGAKMQVFIEEHFDKLSILFVVLLVLGFIVVKYGVQRATASEGQEEGDSTFSSKGDPESKSNGA